ncbi:S49 family peptidase [Methylobacterium segetis]|uniref:S49 family peptidase n=1 Tax=Methylobacterium segetis TaxID=2488750 RepID=UPI00104F37D5|nr:S49 family peptidase [Methylobacterium segetis]
MTTRFPHLRAAMMRRPWAMAPDWLLALVEVVEHRAEGHAPVSAEEFAQRAGQHSRIEVEATIGGVRAENGLATMVGLDAAGEIVAARPGERVAGEPQPGSVIAVIGIRGVIAQHARQVDDISGPGGTSTERVSNSFRDALDDPAVKAIVFDVDSPGGNVHGVQELAAQIRAARGRKPIIAQVNSTAASAAYWLASQADEIVVTPGGEVGSIGVYGMHKDVSVAAEKQGLKVTFISAGPYKVEGNPFEPLSEEAHAYGQTLVDKTYGFFVSDVARGRGVRESVIRNGFGQGRVVLAQDAVTEGMADKVATMDETLRRVAKMKPAPAGPSGKRAEVDDVERQASEADPDQPLEARGPAEPEADAQGEADRQAALERDAFRRRRHAHRLRSSG